MKDEQGNNQGYFTEDRWKFKLVMMPIQDSLHCNKDQAEQMLYALLKEGKIIEIEPGKYKPNIQQEEEERNN